jgi:phosphomevalonate kinase
VTPVSSPDPALAFFAPGKLVLVGEYAVVDGAPAIVLAVDRGVRCVRRPAPGLEIDTPTGDDRFVRPALAGRSGRFTFTDAVPASTLSKPGFGGSAAACVVACAAAGRPLTDAFALHHAVQGGGSGVDVAASIAGGMIRYEAGLTKDAGPPVTPLVIWSGASAATGPRVAAYRAWPGRAAFVAESADISARFPTEPLAALRASGDLLVAMAAAAGLDYLTPAHAELRRLAARFGGAAKPSGAGGGDIAVALFPGPEAAADFSAAVTRAGFLLLPVRPAAGAGPVPG